MMAKKEVRKSLKIGGNRGSASSAHRFPHIRENNAAMGLKMALESMFKISFGFTVCKFTFFMMFSKKS